MPAPQPFETYRSRTEAVAGFRRAGMSWAQIGARMGISKNSVRGLHASARRKKGYRAQDWANQVVSFPPELIEAAASHASERRINVNELFRRIVEEVIAGKLIDAVLDDKGRKRA